MMRWMALWCLLLSCGAEAQSLPRVVRMAVGEGKPPYTFSNPPGGIQYDILTLIVKRMGGQPDILIVPLARAQTMFDEGAVDATLGVGGRFPSQPFIAYRNVAITLRSRGLVLNSIADLRSLRVVAFQNARTFLGPEFGAMADANPDYEEVSPQVIANQLLFSGRTDAVVSDIHIFTYLNREAQFVDVSQPLTIHPLFPITRYRMIFHDANLRDAFDRALKSVLAEDPYPALAKKYLPDTTGTDFRP